MTKKQVSLIKKEKKAKMSDNSPVGESLRCGGLRSPDWATGSRALAIWLPLFNEYFVLGGISRADIRREKNKKGRKNTQKKETR